MVKTTCLINNYNYSAFVVEAVQSAIQQSIRFDEIIVVDDGSTDNSLEILTKTFGDRQDVKIISKPNEGQLSCFKCGFAASSGELIFFLDADDCYERNYLEETLKFYTEHPDCDFLFCGMQEFGCSDRLRLPYDDDLDFGYTVMLTLYLKKWIGAPTSTISIRRNLLAKILPIPDIADWRIRADDCLVWGTSLLGGRKYYLAKSLIRYRVHQSNNFHGKSFNESQRFQRTLTVNRIFQQLIQRAALEGEWFDPLKLTYDEFRIKEKPSFKNLRNYLKIMSRLKAGRVRKIKGQIRMVKYYFQSSARE